jgi:hypothetical protein
LVAGVGTVHPARCMIRTFVRVSIMPSHLGTSPVLSARSCGWLRFARRDQLRAPKGPLDAQPAADVSRGSRSLPRLQPPQPLRRLGRSHSTDPTTGRDQHAQRRAPATHRLERTTRHRRGAPDRASSTSRSLLPLQRCTHRGRMRVTRRLPGRRKFPANRSDPAEPDGQRAGSTLAGRPQSPSGQLGDETLSMSRGTSRRDPGGTASGLACRCRSGDGAKLNTRRAFPVRNSQVVS